MSGGLYVYMLCMYMCIYIGVYAFIPCMCAYVYIFVLNYIYFFVDTW